MKIVQYIDLTPFEYERITGITAAAVVRLTQALRENAQTRGVFITIETSNIRYRVDGGEPDANNGHLVYAAQNIYLRDPSAIREFRMIGSGGTAVAIVTYYK